MTAQGMLFIRFSLQPIFARYRPPCLFLGSYSELLLTTNKQFFLKQV